MQTSYAVLSYIFTAFISIRVFSKKEIIY